MVNSQKEATVWPTSRPETFKHNVSTKGGTHLVRAQHPPVYKQGSDRLAPHTYLDGTSPFTYPGLWAVETPHSTATLSTQGVAAACMGFGSCTVSIFSCPASATLAGWAPFFSIFLGSNPNPRTVRIHIGSDQHDSCFPPIYDCESPYTSLFKSMEFEDELISWDDRHSKMVHKSIDTDTDTYPTIDTVRKQISQITPERKEQRIVTNSHAGR